jgi:hypothetical protein
METEKQSFSLSFDMSVQYEDGEKKKHKMTRVSWKKNNPSLAVTFVAKSKSERVYCAYDSKKRLLEIVVTAPLINNPEEVPTYRTYTANGGKRVLAFSWKRPQCEGGADDPIVRTEECPFVFSDIGKTSGKLIELSVVDFFEAFGIPVPTAVEPPTGVGPTSETLVDPLPKQKADPSTEQAQCQEQTLSPQTSESKQEIQ